MKKINVLQTPIRFSPYIGGVENHVLYLSKQLVKMGHVVKVICSEEPKSNKKKINGISVERLPFMGKVTNTNISLSLPLKILKTDFDVIHTHMPTPWTSDWSMFLGKIMGKKTIITIHNDMDKSSFISKLVTKLYLNTFFRITLAFADRIIIVNPDWKQSFKATKHLLLPHNKKISVIPNGVDLSQFKNIKKSASNNTVIFVSILDKHHKFKGFDYLLESVAMVKKTNPTIQLLIVGEGELKKYYQKKAVTLGLKTNVQFVGKISQKNLASYYKKASVFVLPSTEIEGFGIVLLEAMASKLPVITTPIAGVWKEVKKYNTGLIVKQRNSLQLSSAIKEILKNKKKATVMGENGYKLVNDYYNWQSIARNIEKTYKEVLQ